MDDKSISFVPFHAINNFMVDEYRYTVIQDVLSHFDQLTSKNRSNFQNLFKKYVTIPGFRNSSVAPLQVKIRGTNNAFEKKPQFTIQVLACWAEIHMDLQKKVYDLLVKRGWELLPIEADKTVLPGFMVKWHKTDSYDVINQAYKEMYPDDSSSENDVRLMSVWLSGRLPYEIDEEEPEEKESQK